MVLLSLVFLVNKCCYIKRFWMFLETNLFHVINAVSVFIYNLDWMRNLELHFICIVCMDIINIKITNYLLLQWTQSSIIISVMVLSVYTKLIYLDYNVNNVMKCTFCKSFVSVWMWIAHVLNRLVLELWITHNNYICWASNWMDISQSINASNCRIHIQCINHILCVYLSTIE